MRILAGILTQLVVAGAGIGVAGRVLGDLFVETLGGFLFRRVDRHDD